MILVYNITMNTKKCLLCNKEFLKKYTHSKKYWSTAKYCSTRCGRLSNNPAKLPPNSFFIIDGVVYIETSKKNKYFTLKVNLDDYQNNKIISSSRWSLDKNGYGENGISINGKNIKRKLHWEVLGRKTGYIIDHINGDILDNRKENLRHLTHRQNIRNRKITNKIGINGSILLKRGIKVVIKDNNSKLITIGIFKNRDDAIKARINAEKKYWGISFLEEKMI